MYFKMIAIVIITGPDLRFDLESGFDEPTGARSIYREVNFDCQTFQTKRETDQRKFSLLASS